MKSTLIKTNYIGTLNIEKTGECYFNEVWFYRPKYSAEWYRVPYVFLTHNLEFDSERKTYYLEHDYKGKNGRFYVRNGKTEFFTKIGSTWSKQMDVSFFEIC